MRSICTLAVSALALFVTSAAMAGSGVDGETTVPEPTAIALFAAGAAGILLLRRRIGKGKK